MSQIKAAEGSILKGAKTVADTRQTLTSEIKSIESKMAAIGANWQGNAAVSFQQLMTQWHDKSNGIVKALDDFEANLTKSQHTMDESDSQQQSAMSSIASRLS